MRGILGLNRRSLPGWKSNRRRLNRASRSGFFESLEPRRVLEATPIISEVLARNDRTLFDEDGEDSDFIEIHNVGDDGMTLHRYFLTDDSDNLRKWRFPDVQLGGGEYLVVFASGNDRNDAAGELHTNFRLSGNGEYLALVEPDGQTVAYEYASGFPQQATDVSFGVPTGIVETVILDRNASGRVIVPTDDRWDPTELDAVAGTWLDREFDDSDWTPVTMGVGFVSSTEPATLADSVADFSNQLDNGGWSYGRWTKNFDRDGVYGADDFTVMNESRDFDMGANEWSSGGMVISATSALPTASGFIELAAVRRWTSETEGEITISGQLANLDASGDGVAVGIYVNGVAVLEQEVDGASEDYTVTANVLVGDFVDFVVDAGSAKNDDGDQTVFTATIVGLELNEVPQVDVANAIEDFARSNVQGIGNSWYYGYYDMTVDRDGGYQESDFQAFLPEYYGARRWDFPGDVATQIRNTSQRGHADGETVHWGIRRWTSTVDGTLVIEYEYAKSQAGGDGTTGRIFHNGVEIDTIPVAGGDRDGVSRTITLQNVHRGDTFDFATDPLGPGVDPNQRDGENDRSKYKVQIRRITDVGESIVTDIGGAARGVGSSAYLRVPFQVESVTDLDEITLEVQYDDAFVAYINGQRVASANSPDVPGFNSTALTERTSEEATLFDVIDLTDWRSLFREGENVLQLHAINAAANDEDLLIQAEISIGTVVAEAEERRYFDVPTPGAANGIGSRMVGPKIVATTHSPQLVNAADPIVVTAEITETFNEVQRVNLNYRVMYSDIVQIPMADDGQGLDQAAGDGVYTAEIPGNVAAPGEMVRWYINATDSESLVGRLPIFERVDKDQEYFGTMIHDPTVASNLPIFHFFVDIKNFTRGGVVRDGSVYYGGEFYSNIKMTGHGQSSSGFPKKSFNLDFPNDHRLLLEEGLSRIEDVNLLTNYADKSKMRNTLAYQQLALTGGASHLAFPIHVRNNGEFAAVYDFVEDAGESWLERLGFDPRGTLYKMYNSFEGPVGEKKTNEDTGNELLAELVDSVRTSNGSESAEVVDASVAYVMDNVNIARMANFLAGFALTSDLDCCHKNYYVYKDELGTGEWWFLPWDNDLSYGRNWNGSDTYFDDTMHPNNGLYIAGSNRLVGRLYDDVPGFREMYKRRVRTLIDDHVKPPGTPREELPLENRVDELFELMRVDADRDNERNPATWGEGFQSFEEAVQILLEEYAEPRRRFLYETQMASDRPFLNEFLSGDPGAETAAYFVPTDDSLGTDWTLTDFDDSQWPRGPMGIGFERGGNRLGDLIRTDLGDQVEGKTSVYVRIPFTIEDLPILSGLIMSVKHDGGFVAYINGREVCRKDCGVPDRDPKFDSTSPSRGGVRVAHDINLSSYLRTSALLKDGAIGKMVSGENVLGLHLINSSPDDDNMLMLARLFEPNWGTIPSAQIGNPQIDFGAIEFNPRSGNQEEEYIAFTNPNQDSVDISGWRVAGEVEHAFDPGTVLVPGASIYITPNKLAFVGRSNGPSGGQKLFVQGNYRGTLNNNGGQLQLIANDGEVVSQVSYEGQLNSLQDLLRISEVMYHPRPASAAELAADNSLIAEDFEWVEIVNVSTDTVAEIDDARLTNGVQFDFSGGRIQELGPGERALVVRNESAFAIRYGDAALDQVAGVFSANTALRDAGERLTLASGDGTLIVDFVYSDVGHQGWPERAGGEGSSLQIVDVLGNANEPTNWRASYAIGGTPGTVAMTSASPMLINEVLARPNGEESDRIELYNSADVEVILANYYLSDDPGNLTSYALPRQNLGPGEYLLLDDSDFGGDDGFGISSGGERLFLSMGDANRASVFVDSVNFGASVVGESFGRVPNGQGRLYPNESTTFGAANSGPRVGPVVISEVSYAAGEPTAEALALDPNLDTNELEFVEIYNPTDQPVSLADWRLRMGIDHDFGTQDEIPAGGTLLVIGFNPDRPANADRLAAFRKHYRLSEDVILVGGYDGQLSRAGEGVQLQRSEVVDDTLTLRLIVDEVVYDTTAPWPTAVDGQSLNRTSASAYGNDAESWTSGSPSPGRFVSLSVGDLTKDGIVDLKDADRLQAAALSGDIAADLDGNGVVDTNDLRHLVVNVIGSRIGDVNGDDRFDSEDIVALFVNGGYNDGIAGNATYRTGDWNLDGEFDADDLVFVMALGGYVTAPSVAAAVAATPEVMIRQTMAPLANTFAPATEIQRERPLRDQVANDHVFESWDVDALDRGLDQTADEEMVDGLAPLVAQQRLV